MRTKLVVGVVLGLFVLSTWLLGHIYGELLTAYEQMPALQDLEYSWIFRLLLNLLGYSTVILPLYGLYKYLEKTNYFDKISNNDRLSRWLRALFCEHERLPEGAGPGAGVGAGAAGGGAGDARARDGLEFAFCFTGLMGAYLVWGLLQEKIMTQDYVMSDGSVSRFTDSQFLVFINRLLGFLIALARLLATRRPVLGAPLYKFSYCALSNVVSAWCQYEALKFVSFPTQVLSKSCKVIPVMLMGKLISRCKYETYEYATAALISVGMALFLFGVRDEAAGGGSSSGGGGYAGASGAALLALYLACDGFTSSWQGALFRRHSLRPLQMLCCVSLCSCGLTAAALARRPAPALVAHPAFLADAALLAASSAAGQLLIYRTIARFGPALFAMAMTARQACSVLLSCAVYGHRVPGVAAAGALLVLAAVLLRLHCRRPDRRAA